MELEIHCTACKVPLRVPIAAAGHRARCPACKHEFVVPQMQDLLEETVSEWIEHDVEEVFDEKVQAYAPQTPRTTPQPQPETASVGAAARGGGATLPPKPETRRPAGDSDIDRPLSRTWPMRNDPRHAVPGDAVLPDNGHDDHAAPPEEPQRHAPKRVFNYNPVRTVSTTPRTHAPSTTHSDGDGRYPTNLHVEERIPHLMVVKVDPAGVRFAFDSHWLKHEGFRASFPVRCVFSGATQREKLIARPLLFMDRARTHAPTAEQLTAQYESRQLGDRSPREIMKSIGTMEGLHRPFAYAMPYYVSTRYAHLALHTETRDRTSGGITCEVVIPDAFTALDWLARVNGVTGREYEALEQDVGLLHGDAWQELSDDVRGRIGVWCKLGPREGVRKYYNDADFGKRDEGLAGLVITDQRLVYSKYHHRGQVRLDNDDATVIARSEGKFVSLTLRVGSDLQRMVKLHRHDLDDLTQTLANCSKIRVEVQD